MACILVTRPNHDLPTIYLYRWSEALIHLAKRKLFTVLDLNGDKADRVTFEKYLRVNRPIFVFLNGHGTADDVRGIGDEIIIDKDTKGKDIQGVVIYARSCDAGVNLGSILCTLGAKTFVGYDRPFSVITSNSCNSRPLEDSMAKLFLDPSNLLVSTMLKGNTVSEANERSKTEMKRNISHLITRGDTSSATYLYNNLLGQVLFGDQDAIIKP